MTQSDEQWDAIEDDGVLDNSDTLDGNPAGDPLDVGYQAADRWSGADRFGTTAAEQRQGESLDQLLAEEEPDIDPYADPDPDADEDDISRRGEEQDPRAGRLVAQDEGLGPDTERDSVAYDTGIDYGAASAEEAAIHVTDDPNGPGEGPRL
jgi:hypothetical protein